MPLQREKKHEQRINRDEALFCANGHDSSLEAI